MLRRIFSYMKEYKKYAWLALICIGVEVVLEIMVPKLMADLIDIGVTNSDVPYIINKGIQMAVCAVAALILGVGSARFSALAGQGLGANIRKAEYEKLQSYSFSNIDHFSVSSLVTRLTSDVTNIQNAVSTGMRPFGRSPVMLIFATTLAFQINSTLALVFLVALPVLAVLLIIIIINVGPRYGRMQGAVDLVNRCIEENLTAVRVVKSYVRGDYEIEKFRNVNDNLKNESEKAFGIAVLNMPAMQFVMYSTILGILLIGGRLINSGQMMIGQLTSFLSYVLLILNSLMMMSNVFLLMTRSLASAERIMKIIDEYTREAGVRNLKREFITLCRKLARDAVEQDKKKFIIKSSSLEKYLGKPKFRPEKLKEKEPKLGVVNGLAWTSVGGVTLEVQGVAIPGKGELSLTGTLGNVMKESAQVAFTYVKANLDKYKLENPEFFEKKNIHLHFPEGATPKDGPSAGITIVTAILSVLTGRKVRQDIAMTGEVTITGEVLAIGGVKEKVIGAHRAGIREVILPEDNRVDESDIPAEVAKTMKIHFVKTYDEVEKLVFA